MCKIGLNSWLKFNLGKNRLYIIFRQIVLEAANLVVTDRLFFMDSRLSEIWRELAPHYFLANRFGWRQLIWWWRTDYFYGQKVIWDLAGTGSTLFSGRMFWRQTTGWWWPDYDDIQTIISDLTGTGSTLFSGGLFWRHPIWWWRTDYFYGQQVIWDLAGTGTTSFSGGLFLGWFFSELLSKSIRKVSTTATCRLEWRYQLSKKIMPFSLSNIETQWFLFQVDT